MYRIYEKDVNIGNCIEYVYICGMPVSAVGTINSPCGLGPFQQALHPLLATSVPLILLRLRLIQSSLMGATVSSTSAFDRCPYTIQYN